MSGANDKLVYRLWWEFLKRSDDYREYCEWQREKRKNPETPPPEKLVQKGFDPEGHPFVFIYGLFLDVHARKIRGRPYTFEVWWEKNEPFLSGIHDRNGSESVRDYSSRAHDHIQSLIKKTSDSQGREPSLAEFQTRFVRELQTGMPPRLYLEVDLTETEAGPLVRQFNELLTSLRESPRIRFWKNFSDDRTWPTSKLTLLELKRYILVYDLWKKGKSMPEIVMKVGTESQKKHYSDPNVHAVFREDLAKAKAIIKNVEQGAFPGFYGKYNQD